MRRRRHDGRGHSPGTVGVGGYRGWLAGSVMAALAIAAHGMAGGPLPGSAGLTLLLVAAATIGVLAAHLRSPGTLVALMAVGQPACHVALSGLAHGEHGSGAMDFVTDGAMAAAHGVATVAFAFLILVAERLYRVVSQAVRAVTTRPAAVPVAIAVRWKRTTAPLPNLTLTGTGGSRAPPLTA